MRQFFVWLLLCWVVGIASGQWLTAASLLVIIVALAAIGWATHWAKQIVVAGLLLTALGFVYGQPRDDQLQSCSSAIPLEGTVTITPRLLADRGQYIIETAPDCRLQLTTARFPAYREGDRLQLEKATIRPIATLENEGYAAYLRRQHIYATAQYPTITVVRSTTSSSAATWLEPVITRVFLEPDTGVIRALLLANTDGLPAHLQENFRITGLSHLLAISGMNISLLTGLLVSLLYLVPLSPLSRTLLISGLLWAYMALLDWPISAVRATFFWTIALLGLRLHVLVSLPTVILLTLLAILSLNPLLVADVGFQLSVSAVIGIFLILFLSQRYLRTLPSLPKIVLGSLLVTIGATLATGPIIAYHFGTVSLLSIPANILVAPVVGIQMVTGIMAVLIGIFFPVGAMIPAYLFHVTVVWMDVVSAFLAAQHGVYLQNLTVPPVIVVSYYGVLLTAAYWWLRRQRRSWLELWQ